jgi:uncharacterized protein (DUF433 family)
MREPSPALCAAALQLFRHADLRSGASLVRAWTELLSQLPARETPQLPRAVDRVLPLLQGDFDRLRLAVDLFVSLDLYETAPTLVAMAARTGSADLALAAAWFALHPGVSDSVGAAAAELPRRVVMSERQSEAMRVRLDSSYEPSTAELRRLREVAWPGLSERNRLVAIVDESPPRPIELLVEARLAQAGARIRRVPALFQKSAATHWLAESTPIVAWRPDVVSLLRSQNWVATAASLLRGPETPYEVGQLLSHLSGRLGLARAESAAGHRRAIGERLDPELLNLGSLDIRDMAFLGGGGLSTLYDLAADRKLPPRYVGTRDRLPVWTFGQLVAFRTWRRIQADLGRRRFPTSLVHRLETLAESRKPSELGVSADGRLLTRRQNTWADIESGQEVIEEVLAVDEIFRPFSIGGGQIPVPDLLEPARSLQVDPSVLGGTPVIKKTRISARAMAEIDRSKGLEAVREAFPSLSDISLREALAVGHGILMKS